jgi:hypothetical protein
MVSNKLLGLPPVLLCRTHTSIVSCHIHLIQTRSQIWHVKAIMRMKFLKFFILVLIGLGFFFCINILVPGPVSKLLIKKYVIS